MSTQSIESNIICFGKDMRMTRKQLACITCMSSGYFLLMCYFSLFAPFFPREAKQKGLNSFDRGFVFGIYQLVLLVCGPIFGKYLNVIGVRFLVVSGYFLSAGSMIVFGFLNDCPAGVSYFVLALASRAVSALGGSMSLSYAIAAQFFPSNVATVVSVLEIFAGLGLMMGPFIGGILYQLGGFKLPFFTLGGIMTVLFVVAFFIFPDVPKISDEGGKNVSFPLLPILKIVRIDVTLLMIFLGSFGIAFTEPAIQIHLLPLNLSPVQLGLVFLVPALIYAILTPFVGHLCDKKPKIMPWLIIVSTIFSIVSYCFFGPLPWFGMDLKLSTFMFAYNLFGISFSILIVPVYADLSYTLKTYHGYPNDLRTQGLVSGLFSSAYSTGAMFGPIFGGTFIHLIGFGMSTFILAVFFSVGGLLYSLVFFSSYGKSTVVEPVQLPSASESEPLLQGNNKTVVVNEESLH